LIALLGELGASDTHVAPRLPGQGHFRNAQLECGGRAKAKLTRNPARREHGAIDTIDADADLLRRYRAGEQESNQCRAG
jgi:hypothetical protein